MGRVCVARLQDEHAGEAQRGRADAVRASRMQQHEKARKGSTRKGTQRAAFAVVRVRHTHAGLASCLM